MSTPLIHESADLFAGAGGTTRGLLNAARRAGVRVNLRALNHWLVAITSHELNHPDVEHFWADIQGIQPREVVKGGRLHSMVASPECIYFSRARGGKPVNDQRRSSASYLLSWVRQLEIDDVLIENVPEFEQWGPLYPDTEENRLLKIANKPIPELRGVLFQEFISKLRQRGYHVEWRVLCAADYGDPTTRERLFIRARLGNRPITWPAPTHSREHWRAAREIIDWSKPGTSIYYGRKKPLVPATMRRILAGVYKFSGLAPFIIPNFGERSGQDPRCHSIDAPLPTVTSHGAGALVQPCLIEYHGDHRGNADGDGRSRSVDEPLPTICANGTHIGLTVPFLTEYYGTGGAESIDDPLNTITAKDRFGLAEPVLSRAGAHLLEALKHPDPTYRPLIAEIDGILYLVDILYRMLLVKELAAGMGFPPDYIFHGTLGDQVRQVGNAVPLGLSEALCYSMLVN